MAKLTKIFNKNTALDVLYVGGGAVAGTLVGSKVYDAVADKVDAEGKLKPYISGGVPIAVGLLLPSFAGKSNLINKLSLGMIASGGSLIVKELLSKAGVENLNGVGNVMMGNVMMQGTSATGDLGNGPSLAGAGATAGGYDQYTPTSYDTTPAFAGEMDY